MNLIIVLTSRFLQFVNLQKVKEKLQHTEFIIILDKSKKASFALNEIQKNFFDRIYEVSSKKTAVNDPLPKFSVKEVKKIIQNEINFREYNQVRLVCLDEGNLLLAEKLQKELGIIGSYQDKTENFRDKLLMKKVLGKSQIPVPPNLKFNKFYAEKNTRTYYEELISFLGKKFILKPKAHAASFGIFIINNYPQFLAALLKINHSALIYEAESFIEGELYHCDALLQNGKILFLKSCQYSCPNLEFTFGKNLLNLPLLEQNPLAQRTMKFAQRCLFALGAKMGAFHLELFRNKQDELIFLEVAARSPGLLIIQMYEKMYDINMVETEFYIKCGLKITINESVRPYCLAGWFPIKEGKVIKRCEPEIDSPYKLNWAVELNEQLENCSSLADYAASLLAWNNDYSILKNDFEKLKKYQPILVKK